MVADRRHLGALGRDDLLFKVRNLVRRAPGGLDPSGDVDHLAVLLRFEGVLSLVSQRKGDFGEAEKG